MSENLATRLLEAVGKYSKMFVFCGDAIRDHWVHGRQEPSQDGCYKFVQMGDVVLTPGGTANAANCLTHWRVRTNLYCQSLHEKPHKWRFIDDTTGKVVFRWDNELPAHVVDLWSHDQAMEMIRCADGVYLSDYDKGFLTPAFIQEVIEACRKRAIPCVADVKREPDVYRGAVVKCNEEYAKKFSPSSALVTRGALPPIMKMGPGGFPHFCGGEPHVGAGDCFGAHFPPVPLVSHVGAGDCRQGVRSITTQPSTASRGGCGRPRPPPASGTRPVGYPRQRRTRWKRKNGLEYLGGTPGRLR